MVLFLEFGNVFASAESWLSEWSPSTKWWENEPWKCLQWEFTNMLACTELGCVNYFQLIAVAHVYWEWINYDWMAWSRPLPVLFYLNAESPTIQMHDLWFSCFLLHWTLPLEFTPTKTLDTAHPCHLLKTNWKLSPFHSTSAPANINTQFSLQSVCVCVCVCVCVRACVRVCTHVHTLRLVACMYKWFEFIAFTFFLVYICFR